jgi:hypothetical protein
MILKFPAAVVDAALTFGRIIQPSFLRLKIQVSFLCFQNKYVRYTLYFLNCLCVMFLECMNGLLTTV